MRKIIIFIILVLFIFFTASAKAGIFDNLPGPEVMPDDPLYFLKIWYEKIITFLNFGDAKKAERYSKIAEKRLYEAEKMAEKGKQELTKRLLKEYENYLDKAVDKLEEIKQEVKQKIKEEIKKEINQRIEEIKTRAEKLIDEFFGE